VKWTETGGGFEADGYTIMPVYFGGKNRWGLWHLGGQIPGTSDTVDDAKMKAERHRAENGND